MLYTKEYKTILKGIHSKETWGGGAKSKVHYVAEDAFKVGAKTVLDYGCGSGSFKEGIQEEGYSLEVLEYDPGIIGKDSSPTPADYVVCIDVLEHIEPECLDAVLKDLASLMRLGGFLHPCLVPAGLTLPDGRNAHLIVQDADWWDNKIKQYFNIHSYKYKSKGHVAVFVRPK